MLQFNTIQNDVCDALNQIKEKYALEKENEAEETKSQTQISLNPKNASLALAFLDECKLINWKEITTVMVVMVVMVVMRVTKRKLERKHNPA